MVDIIIVVIIIILLLRLLFKATSGIMKAVILFAIAYCIAKVLGFV